MVKSLYSGVSGLKTHQSKMDVIGNNIANVNTTGFKTGVVTFKDVYYQNKINPSAGTSTLGGVNPAQVGYGVRLNSTVANMTQSGFTYTDSKWDMALDGEGFFQVMDGSGNIFYTRAGAFSVDADGYLVNASGYHVLGVTGDSNGVEPSSEVIRIIIPDTDAHASSATKKVNGVNVTLSMSAPSDNTDMSVTFTPAEYPYATYANGILNIFFNQDEQYASEDAFEQAIQKALDAGGVTLPDGCSLQFEFESIPDNPEAVIAKNSITGLNFKTTNDSCMFHETYTETDATGATITKHAYIGFATSKVLGDKVAVKINYDPSATAVSAAFAAASGTTPGTWTITVNADSTAEEINNAIKEQTSANITYPELTCTNYVLPSEKTTRGTVLTSMGAAALLTDGTNGSTGGFDVAATVAGEFANNYKVTFAYVAGYGKTNAVWNENELTITVCNDTTVADINDKIKTAARGNEKKILTMANISGLKNNSMQVSKTAGGTYDVIVTDPSGAQKIVTGATAVAANGTITGGTTTFRKPDGTTGAAADFTEETVTSTWNPQMREAFFGGNPSISPMDGADSFFTGVAKSLSTFALEDGRLGGPQPLDSCDVVIQTDGTIVGIHPVHGYLTLGRIDVALFENPNGLSQAGGTNFAETVASGSPKLATAGGDSGAGSILSNTLEMSNVDLSQEFTDMITTQRGFQANSRVITVSDTMLEELLSLKR
ncbi:MAG: flagellar hook-basal body complex protein [[Eubacterium] saphenum]|nr:flagellar hook-basal body complex protein [[Eubacterium] saphenum]